MKISRVEKSREHTMVGSKAGGGRPMGEARKTIRSNFNKEHLELGGKTLGYLCTHIRDNKCFPTSPHTQPRVKMIFHENAFYILPPDKTTSLPTLPISSFLPSKNI
jgi:hypothetical protein